MKHRSERERQTRNTANQTVARLIVAAVDTRRSDRRSAHYFHSRESNRRRTVVLGIYRIQVSKPRT
jgi:hypothetical protein